MKQIYINGKVFTGDKNLKSAFIVEGDRFSYVGCDKEALEKKEDGDIVIDLEKAYGYGV